MVVISGTTAKLVEQFHHSKLAHKVRKGGTTAKLVEQFHHSKLAHRVRKGELSQLGQLAVAAEIPQ